MPTGPPPPSRSSQTIAHRPSTTITFFTDYCPQALHHLHFLHRLLPTGPPPPSLSSQTIAHRPSITFTFFTDYCPQALHHHHFLHRLLPTGPQSPSLSSQTIAHRPSITITFFTDYCPQALHRHHFLHRLLPTGPQSPSLSSQTIAHRPSITFTFFTDYCPQALHRHHFLHRLFPTGPPSLPSQTIDVCDTIGWCLTALLVGMLTMNPTAAFKLLHLPASRLQHGIIVSSVQTKAMRNDAKKIFPNTFLAFSVKSLRILSSASQTFFFGWDHIEGRLDLAVATTYSRKCV